MNNIVDIEILSMETGSVALAAPTYCKPDYPRWFRYQENFYSLCLMARTKRPGWDFETSTSNSNGTVYAAVLDEKTVKVGRIPLDAGDN